MALTIGDMAPDFELSSQDGTMVRLSHFRGKKAVVLYFYHKDFTPGCTKQACTFRDVYTEFQKAGAEVIGISSDDVENHSAFSQKYALPFPILSDAGKTVRKLYGGKGYARHFAGTRYIYNRQNGGDTRNIFFPAHAFKTHKCCAGSSA
jgi:peroxiredoxin Q/BCP